MFANTVFSAPPSMPATNNTDSPWIEMDQFCAKDDDNSDFPVGDLCYRTRDSVEVRREQMGF
jgi:hypothetical protein